VPDNQDYCFMGLHGCSTHSASIAGLAGLPKAPV
jgi:hypothetical protein